MGKAKKKDKQNIIYSSKIKLINNILPILYKTTKKYIFTCFVMYRKHAVKNKCGKTM